MDSGVFKRGGIQYTDRQKTGKDGERRVRRKFMKRLTSLADWLEWAGEGWTMLPFLARAEGPEQKLPPTWAEAWRQASPYALVLESGKSGRYTYLGLEPVSVLTGKGMDGEVKDLRTGETRSEFGKPLVLLEEWMKGYRAPRLPELPLFQGGCAGYLGYDVVRSLERLPILAEDDTGIPDYLWMRFEEVWIYDHQEEAVYFAVHAPWDPHNGMDTVSRLDALFQEAEARAEKMATRWEALFDAAEMAEASSRQSKAAALTDDHAWGWDRLESDFSQEDFEAAVRKVQAYIRQGDVFQVNLSIRRHLPLLSDPSDIYEWLRVLNPSPYMGYLASPGFSLVSGSPELLIKLNGDRVSARPIAGTRRRGSSPEEDAAMEAELRETEKERAEHIMLVDLERNDIGRIAAYGSVRVPELMTVERYSHVMHLVSQVEGMLAEGKRAYDVIAAAFPGGTITGAPKIRTMEIIEELEPVTRGPYTGSMGWIGYNGDMELNIIIRTLAVRNGTGYIQAGAGIVIDSDPYREYRECHNKAKALIAAVMCSEEEAGLKAATLGG